MVTVASFFAHYIYDGLTMLQIAILSDGGMELFSKCAVTPITMMANFVSMKILSEKM